MLGARAKSFRTSLISAALLLTVSVAAQTAKPIPLKKVAPPAPPSAGAMRGKPMFVQNCAFCHGRDAAGGETGPDLTRSRLVMRDVTGDKIRGVIHTGRFEKGMPAFPRFTPAQLNDLIAYIRDQTRQLNSKPGGRRGVDVADLQTGDVAAGTAYFNGPWKCSSCHSPTGDLAGIATKYVGLELEKRMLYPEDAKPKVSVTTSSGESFSGVVAYHDEFYFAMIDSDGWYHSWPIKDLQYKIDPALEGHIDLFEKYTDADIHNLMAYLQTLR